MYCQKCFKPLKKGYTKIWTKTTIEHPHCGSDITVREESIYCLDCFEKVDFKDVYKIEVSKND